MKEHIKGWVTLVVGFLMAMLGFLATLNIKYEWLTTESITAFGVVLAALLMLVINTYAIVKKAYVTKKDKKRLELMKRNGLK